MKTFYKASMIATEEGLAVRFVKFFSIRETEHVCFCLRKYDLDQGEMRVELATSTDTLELVRLAKEKKMRVYRVAKRSARIAFPTKELAIEDLALRKRYQLRHLIREQAFCQKFLELKKDGSIQAALADQRNITRYDYAGTEDLTLPETDELVWEYLNFN